MHIGLFIGFLVLKSKIVTLNQTPLAKNAQQLILDTKEDYIQDPIHFSIQRSWHRSRLKRMYIRCTYAQASLHTALQV
jgi:hypothetical protein